MFGTSTPAEQIIAEQIAHSRWEKHPQGARSTIILIQYSQTISNDNIFNSNEKKNMSCAFCNHSEPSFKSLESEKLYCNEWCQKFDYHLGADMIDLPADAIMQIMYNLSIQELGRMCQANKKINRICKRDDFKMNYIMRNGYETFIRSFIFSTLFTTEELDTELAAWFRVIIRGTDFIAQMKTLHNGFRTEIKKKERDLINIIEKEYYSNEPDERYWMLENQLDSLKKKKSMLLNSRSFSQGVLLNIAVNNGLSLLAAEFINLEFISFTAVFEHFFNYNYSDQILRRIQSTYHSTMIDQLVSFQFYRIHNERLPAYSLVVNPLNPHGNASIGASSLSSIITYFEFN